MSINSRNTPPVADAGPDQSLPVGATATLDASASSDVEGDPLTYNWTLLSQPAGSSAALSDPHAINPTFIADRPGSYAVLLDVSDGISLSLGDTVTITTLNSPPVANAGPDQAVLLGATATLDAGASTDVDGDPLSFRWALLSKPAASLAALSEPSALNPTFTVDIPGTYVAQLIVNDGAVDSAPDTVTVSTRNSPPVADAGPDQSVFVGDLVTLDAGASTDPDGDPLGYAWSLTAVPPGSAAALSDPSALNPTFTVDLPGGYVAQLLVNDGTADSAPDTVTVNTRNSRPVADAGPDRSVATGATVTLDASASHDADGDPLSYLWSLTAVPPGSAAALSDPGALQPTFSADVRGSYLAQLIVNDGALASAPDTVTVQTLNQPPVAQASVPPSVRPGVAAVLDASASFDPDGDPLSYAWTLVGIPSGSTATLSGAATAQAVLTPDREGTYVLRLVVSDGQAQSAPLALTVTADGTAPLLRVDTPAAGALTNVSSLTVSGSVSEPATVTLNGAPLALAADLSFRDSLTLAEGANPLTFTATDPAGNTTQVLRTVTLDTIPPAAPDAARIHRGNPRTGRIPVAGDAGAAEPGALLALTNTRSGATAAARVRADGGFAVQIDGYSPDPLTLAATDPAGNTGPSTTLSPPSPLALTLHPIGDHTAPLGRTLRFTVTASDATGGAIALSVAPLPLPAGATFDAASGAFVFAPTAAAVGVHRLTFTARSTTETVAETVTLTVPAADPDAPTRVSGRLLDATALAAGTTLPIAGATVSVLGTALSTVSDADGQFLLSGLAPGDIVLAFDSNTATAAPGGAPYASFRKHFVPVAHVENVIERSVSLPRIALESLTQVVPTRTTVVTNPRLGVTLTVPPNTAFNPDGTPFVGQLSISEVPPGFAPATLPETLGPEQLVTIQPAGTRFATPVPITFPNPGHLAPGSALDLWSVDPDAGGFTIVGAMRVSADGQRIETVSGGVRAADWTTPRAQPPTEPPAKPPAKSDNPPLGCMLKAKKEGASDVSLDNGRLSERIVLPAHRSLGVSRALALAYASDRAYPRPVIAFNTGIAAGSAVPARMSYTLSVGGLAQGAETWLDTAGLRAGAALRAAIAFDATDLASGLYPYRIRITAHFGAAGRTGRILSGRVRVANDLPSPFGAGWTVEGLARLAFNAGGSVTVVATGISPTYHPGPSPDTYTAPDGDFATFVHNPDGTYTRTAASGATMDFDAAGRLTTRADRNANATTYGYDGAGRLVTLTDPAGLVTTLAYNPAGRLATVTDPAGRITTFSHDAEGNLTTVTFPDGATRTFAYDARHLMTAHGDERGNRSVLTYDAAGRLLEATLPDGAERANTSQNGAGLVDPASGQGASRTDPAPTTDLDTVAGRYRDARGHLESRLLDPLGNPLETTDTLGRTTATVRDAAGNTLRTTRPDGTVVTRSFDATGHVLTATEQSDAATTRFAYDPHGLPTAFIDPLGHSTVTERDPRGNPTRISDPLGHVTTLDYDPRGLPTRTTDPDGLVTTLVYNARGLPGTRTATPPPGQGAPRTTTFEYDAAGNLSATTTPDGITTAFEYDARNRLTTVTDAEGGRLTFTYDPAGNLIETATVAPDGTVLEHTTTVYDARNRAVETRTPHRPGSDAVTRTTLDANGNPVATTDPDGNPTAFAYDAADRLTRTTDALGATTARDYDVRDHLTRMAAPDGATTTYAYDPRGRRIAEHSPDRGRLAFAYDKASNLTTVTDARGITATLAYDAADRITAVAYPDATQDVTFGYDACANGIGRLCTRHDPSGGYTLAYDAFGNLSESTRTSGGQPFTTAYGRDAGNRLTTITYPDATTVAYTRDALGRIATVIAGVNGTPVALIDAVGYRADGRIATRSDANGIAEIRAYDARGRLTEQRLTTASGAILATRDYAYDANGNVTRRTESNTTATTTAYGYDPLDRLASEQHDTEPPVTYTHDPNANRLARSQSNRFAETERYRSESNRLEAKETRTTTTVPAPATESRRTLVYNDAGRLAELSEDGALKASYTYDANGLRTAKTTHHPDATTTTVLYHYDEQGRLLEESQADGTPIRDYLWADALPVAQIDHHPATGTYAVVHLHGDQLGTPRLATDASGTVVWRWESDAYGTTPPEQDPDGDGIDTVVNLRFPGQYYDAESGLFYNWHRYYDPETGGYITSDPIGLVGGINTYGYVRGNPVVRTDSGGLAGAPEIATSPFAIEVFRALENFSENVQKLPQSTEIKPDVSDFNRFFSPGSGKYVAVCVERKKCKQEATLQCERHDGEPSFKAIPKRSDLCPCAKYKIMFLRSNEIIR